MKNPPLMPTEACCREIQRKLLSWFRGNSRDLPWRETRDPYRIWVSEILLQQTRVEAVLPYYTRFLNEFPTVSELAGSDEDRLLKVWEGLGYYARARNLQKAARMIVNGNNGKLPDSKSGWLALPGIGRYTAGAIASIVSGERVPAVDGNVKRVLARLFNVTACIDEAIVGERLWVLADSLVPKEAPGDFNQALMELGAVVCLPKKPRCPDCPLMKSCKTFSIGNQEDLPCRRKRKPVPHYDIVAAAIREDGRYLLGKRPPSSMLGGLWEFPGGKVHDGELYEDALARELDEEMSVRIQVGKQVTSVEHAYTHFRITLHVYRCEIFSGRPRLNYHSDLRWVAPGEFDQYAIPAADLKFLHLLE